MKKPSQPAGLPSREQILRFIEQSPGATGKREIAKHFALRGADKIALKALLKDMTDEGLVDMAPGRAFHKHGGLPRVAVLRVAAVEGDAVWAVPERWEGSGPPPRLRVMEKGRRGALGGGLRGVRRAQPPERGHPAALTRRTEPASYVHEFPAVPRPPATRRGRGPRPGTLPTPGPVDAPARLRAVQPVHIGAWLRTPDLSGARKQG